MMAENPLNMEGRYENNPVRDRTPREGSNWWVLVLVLVLAAGIFWALGRSGDADDVGPVSAPAETRIAEPDRIDNNVREDVEDGIDIRVRDDNSNIRVKDDNTIDDVDADVHIDADGSNDRR